MRQALAQIAIIRRQQAITNRQPVSEKAFGFIQSALPLIHAAQIVQAGRDRQIVARGEFLANRQRLQMQFFGLGKLSLPSAQHPQIVEALGNVTLRRRRFEAQIIRP